VRNIKIRPAFNLVRTTDFPIPPIQGPPKQRLFFLSPYALSVQELVLIVRRIPSAPNDLSTLNRFLSIMRPIAIADFHLQLCPPISSLHIKTIS
jgi:hypothetical protein